MSSQGKVVAATNGHDDAVSRTITRTGGGVLVHIGSRDYDSVVPADQTTDGSNVVDPSDAKQRQHAKNTAYLQSSTRQFIDDNNNNDPDEAEVEAGHMIYTKVASVKQETGSPNSDTKSFITRKIIKGRVTEKYKTNDSTHGTEAAIVEEEHGGNRQVLNIEYRDPVNRKKLNYGEDGSIKTLPRDSCYCCRKTVYQKEKIGPIRDVLYHKQCFRCCVCGFVLNLTNFYHNSNDLEDKGLYCKSHEPVAETAVVHINDKRIQSVINKPKVEQLNPNIRGGPGASKSRSIDTHAVGIKGAINAPKLDKYNPTVRVNQESPKGQRHAHDASHVQSNVHDAIHVQANVVHRDPEVRTLQMNAGTQGGHQDNYSVGIKTALNAPKVVIYNPTVRPVPAMVKTVPPAPLRSASEYQTRQIRSPDYTMTPTPPSPSQHVHFNGNTKTYYYVKRK